LKYPIRPKIPIRHRLIGDRLERADLMDNETFGFWGGEFGRTNTEGRIESTEFGRRSSSDALVLDGQEEE